MIEVTLGKKRLFSACPVPMKGGQPIKNMTHGWDIDLLHCDKGIFMKSFITICQAPIVLYLHSNTMINISFDCGVDIISCNNVSETSLYINDTAKIKVDIMEIIENYLDAGMFSSIYASNSNDQVFILESEDSLLSVLLSETIASELVLEQWKTNGIIKSYELWIQS